VKYDLNFLCTYCSLSDYVKAAVDDTLPLSQPITNFNGEVIDSLVVRKGIMLRIPIAAVNQLESLWGPTSHEFDPSRWLDDGTSKKRAEEVSGYRHILSFGDGPRMCLGRLFALTEFKVRFSTLLCNGIAKHIVLKAVISVLVRNYAFEFPNGRETKIEMHPGVAPRPKVAGEEGSRLPFIVRRLN
jgi:cytochrome P450